MATDRENQLAAALRDAGIDVPAAPPAPAPAPEPAKPKSPTFAEYQAERDPAKRDAMMKILDDPANDPELTQDSHGKWRSSALSEKQKGGQQP